MLLYAQRLQTREPIHFGGDLAWYHVGVEADDAHPIRVALSSEALLAGGGDTLYPGTTIDLYGPGVWIKAPKVSGLPFVWVEQRLAPSFTAVDTLGQQRAINGSKVAVFDLTPGVWRNIASDIVGMIAWEVRAEGGKVWVGTHLDTKRPPYDPNPLTGAAWPLEDGEKMRDEGNPTILVWSDVPGAKIRFRKIVRGRAF